MTSTNSKWPAFGLNFSILHRSKDADLLSEYVINKTDDMLLPTPTSR
jgi:hypothetical protein